VVFAPECKLLVSLVIGLRTQDNADLLWADFASRADVSVLELLTSDEYPAHARAFLKSLGIKKRRRLTGETELRFPSGLAYALVHKTREKGRVVHIEIKRLAGTRGQLEEALKRSCVSTHANTSFLERYNATARQGNSRKARKVYTFSKEIEQHVAMSWFAAAYYNFCRPHLGLRVKQDGRWSKRTPAMVAALSDHLWSLREFTRYPLAHKSLCAS